MTLAESFKEGVIIITPTIEGFGNGSTAPTKEGARDISPAAPSNKLIV